MNELTIDLYTIRRITVHTLVEKKLHIGNSVRGLVPVIALDMLKDECNLLKRVTLEFFVLTSEIGQLKIVRDLFGRLTSLTLFLCRFSMEDS